MLLSFTSTKSIDFPPGVATCRLKAELLSVKHCRKDWADTPAAAALATRRQVIFHLP